MEQVKQIASVRSTNPTGGAIEFQGGWHTWSELDEFSKRLDQLLVANEVDSGTRIGLIARNRPGHVAAFASLLATDRCTVMIYSAQSTERIANDIVDLRLPVVIADIEDWTVAALDAARAIGTIAIGLTQNLNAPLVLLTRAAQVGSDLNRRASPGVVMELLSSGTTGAPKRIPLLKCTFLQAVDDAAQIHASDAEAGINASSVVVHPLGNIAGVTFIIPLLFHGHPIALLERFELAAWLELVRQHRPSRASLPPAAIRMLLDAQVPKAFLQSLRSIGVGAAPLDPELQTAFEQHYALPLLPAYGATEFCGVVANWTLELHRKYSRCKRASVGRPRPGISLRVVDVNEGTICNVDEPGVLEVLVPRVGPEWIITTDMARIDADGFLYLLGRADGAINRGGFKVLPEQIAQVLRLHPAVADVAVIGVADRRLTQVPVAAVELRSGWLLGEQELSTFARSHLLAYQVPTRFLVVDALPRNLSMKVSLHDVRSLFDSDLTS